MGTTPRLRWRQLLRQGKLGKGTARRGAIIGVQCAAARCLGFLFAVGNLPGFLHPQVIALSESRSEIPDFAVATRTRLPRRGTYVKIKCKIKQN